MTQPNSDVVSQGRRIAALAAANNLYTEALTIAAYAQTPEDQRLAHEVRAFADRLSKRVEAGMPRPQRRTQWL